jgi:hypothetical protein
VTNPKHDLVALLKAKFNVITAKPPWILLRDFLINKKYDVVFTVKRSRVTPKRRFQSSPLRYDGEYEVAVWCIDKGNVEGDVLRDKAFDEVLRVLKENPSELVAGDLSEQYVSATREDDHSLGGTQIYNSILTVFKKTYI